MLILFWSDAKKILNIILTQQLFKRFGVKSLKINYEKQKIYPPTAAKKRGYDNNKKIIFWTCTKHTQNNTVTICDHVGCIFT